jgi:hypothetical protein
LLLWCRNHRLQNTLVSGLHLQYDTTAKAGGIVLYASDKLLLRPRREDERNVELSVPLCQVE